MISFFFVLMLLENIRFVFESVRNTILADMINDFGVFHQKVLGAQQDDSATESLKNSPNSSQGSMQFKKKLEKVGNVIKKLTSPVYINNKI